VHSAGPGIPVLDSCSRFATLTLCATLAGPDPYKMPNVRLAFPLYF